MSPFAFSCACAVEGKIKNSDLHSLVDTKWFVISTIETCRLLDPIRFLTMTYLDFDGAIFRLFLPSFVFVFFLVFLFVFFDRDGKISFAIYRLHINRRWTPVRAPIRNVEGKLRFGKMFQTGNGLGYPAPERNPVIDLESKDRFVKIMNSSQYNLKILTHHNSTFEKKTDDNQSGMLESGTILKLFYSLKPVKDWILDFLRETGFLLSMKRSKRFCVREKNTV